MIREPKVNLLPCTHCGSHDVRLCRGETVNDDNSHGFCWWVECVDCGIQTLMYPEVYDNTEKDDLRNACSAISDAVDCAVESWNRRVANNDDEVDEAINTMDERMKEMDSIVGDIGELVKGITDQINMIGKAMKHE